MKANSRLREAAVSLRNAVWKAQDQDEDQLKGAKDIRRWALLLKEVPGLSPAAQTLVELILAEAHALRSREEQDVDNHALIEGCAQAVIDALPLPDDEGGPHAPEPGTPVPDAVSPVARAA